MLGQSKQEGTSNVLLTGPQQVQFLKVNPTYKELEEMYGSEPKNEPNYEIVEKNGFTFRPCVFYVKNTKTGKISNFKVNVGQATTTAPERDGNPVNYKIVTDNGKVTWAGKSTDGVFTLKSEFEGFTPLRVGEDTIISFVQSIVGYNPTKEEGYVEKTKHMCLTANDLFEGNYIGFNETLTNAPYENNVLIVNYVVSENDGKYYQNISTNPDLFFSDIYGKGPTQWHSDRIKTRQEGYDMFKNFFYSFESKVFDATNSLGGVPQNPVVEPGGFPASWD